jgi:MFS family permease
LEAPIIFLVSNQLGASYTISIIITLIIPFALSLVTLPFWANYLDQNHVTLFRARQSSLWVLCQVIMFFGAITGSLLVLGLGRLVLGIARGGGSLAWTLGHNDFARPSELGAYMGAHVTLTGIRGAFAPFIGILLYLGWTANGILPAYEGLGAGVFLLAAFLSAISWVGYRRMKLSMALDKTSAALESKIGDKS